MEYIFKSKQTNQINKRIRLLMEWKKKNEDKPLPELVTVKGMIVELEDIEFEEV